MSLGGWLYRRGGTCSVSAVSRAGPFAMPCKIRMIERSTGHWQRLYKICVMTSRQELNGDGDRVLVANSDCVLDALEAKLAALSTACDVANCLLRIDMAIEG